MLGYFPGAMTDRDMAASSARLQRFIHKPNEVPGIA